MYHATLEAAQDSCRENADCEGVMWNTDTNKYSILTQAAGNNVGTYAQNAPQHYVGQVWEKFWEEGNIIYDYYL